MLIEETSMSKKESSESNNMIIEENSIQEEAPRRPDTSSKFVSNSLDIKIKNCPTLSNEADVGLCYFRLFSL